MYVVVSKTELKATSFHFPFVFYIFLGCDPLKGVYLIGLVRVSRHTSSWSFGIKDDLNISTSEYRYIVSQLYVLYIIKILIFRNHDTSEC